jgi:hypothetical protein
MAYSRLWIIRGLFKFMKLKAPSPRRKVSVGEVDGYNVEVVNTLSVMTGGTIGKYMQTYGYYSFTTTMDDVYIAGLQKMKPDPIENTFDEGSRVYILSCCF